MRWNHFGLSLICSRFRLRFDRTNLPIKFIFTSSCAPYNNFDRLPEVDPENSSPPHQSFHICMFKFYKLILAGDAEKKNIATTNFWAKNTIRYREASAAKHCCFFLHIIIFFTSRRKRVSRNADFFFVRSYIDSLVR